MSLSFDKTAPDSSNLSRNGFLTKLEGAAQWAAIAASFATVVAVIAIL